MVDGSTIHASSLYQSVSLSSSVVTVSTRHSMHMCRDSINASLYAHVSWLYELETLFTCVVTLSISVMTHVSWLYQFDLSHDSRDMYHDSIDMCCLSIDKPSRSQDKWIRWIRSKWIRWMRWWLTKEAACHAVSTKRRHARRHARSTTCMTTS